MAGVGLRTFVVLSLAFDCVACRGEERFTLQPSGLEAHGEFALLFDLRDGLITRLSLKHLAA